MHLVCGIFVWAIGIFVIRIHVEQMVFRLDRRASYETETYHTPTNHTYCSMWCVVKLAYSYCWCGLPLLRFLLAVPFVGAFVVDYKFTQKSTQWNTKCLTILFDKFAKRQSTHSFQHIIWILYLWNWRVKSLQQTFIYRFKFKSSRIRCIWN